MTSQRIKRCAAFLLIFASLLSPARLLTASQMDTGRQIREWTPYFRDKTKALFVDSGYEYGWVSIGARRLAWKTFTNRLMGQVRGQLPYVQWTHHERDRVDNYTLDFGTYLNWGKSSLNLETGFGMDTEYIYRYQMRSEYQHPLYGNLSGKLASRYLHYEAGDVMIQSPGLIYYWKDHYLTADYNFSLTESRSDAHWVSAKINYQLSRRFQLWAGFAVGQRMQDIFPIESASKQQGFILFTGLDCRILENIRGRVGFSYSEEKPSFIKRGVDAGLLVRF